MSQKPDIIDNVDLVSIYKGMSEDQIQEEIDAIFLTIYAILEATDTDSIESYPTTNIKLKFSVEDIKDINNKFLC